MLSWLLVKVANAVDIVNERKRFLRYRKIMILKMQQRELQYANGVITLQEEIVNKRTLVSKSRALTAVKLLTNTSRVKVLDYDGGFTRSRL